jgi:hypothetical protein
MSEWVVAGDEFQGNMFRTARFTPAMNNNAAVSIGLQPMGKC